MKTKMYFSAALSIIALSLTFASTVSAWEESDLPADLGNNSNASSSGFQFSMGNTITDEESGWTTSIHESGQRLEGQIEVPAGSFEIQNTEQKTIQTEVSNWQDYSKNINIAGGTGFQSGNESGTIKLHTNPTNENDTLVVANYDSSNHQMMGFQDNPIENWDTHQSDISQGTNFFSRNYDPNGDNARIEFQSRLEQSYERKFELGDMGFINQGGYQLTSVSVNPPTAPVE